jgi:hypothetical protein
VFHCEVRVGKSLLVHGRMNSHLKKMIKRFGSCKG